MREKIVEHIPGGCIYYSPDKLKDKVRSYSNRAMCLYIGKGPKNFGKRTCVESYSKDVVEGIKELIEKGVKLLRIYNGLSLTKLLDAKDKGILKESLETIDSYFTESNVCNDAKK